MIEVLEGVFYDPTKPWYLQDQALIDLALEVEQTQPYDFTMEQDGANVRFNDLRWFHVTEMGTFEFQVTIHYMYAISSNAFLTKEKHNTVNLKKLSDEQL